MEALVGQMTSAYGDFVRQDDMALTNLASSEIEIDSPKIPEIPEIPKIPRHYVTVWRRIVSARLQRVHPSHQ